LFNSKLNGRKLGFNTPLNTLANNAKNSTQLTAPQIFVNID